MRLLLIPLAVVLGLPLATDVQAAPDAHEAGGESLDDSGAPTGTDKRARKARGSRSKSRGKSRRHRHGKAEGFAVPDAKLRPMPPPPPSGNLHLVNIARHEELKVNIYNEDGSYNVESLKAITHLFRCKRTDVERDIEPRLLTVLSHVYDHYEAPIELLSGFRNQRKTTSYHYKASASDVRVPGVPPKKLRAYVESLDAGGMGIGLYPRSEFVHVDVRPPPSYRWVDYSRSDPDSPDKRPPRGWRKKSRKLRS